MAVYNVVKAKHATLVLNVADTVNFSTIGASTFRVTNRGALGAIFLRADGIDPVLQADENYVIPNNTEKLVVVGDSQNPQIRLISAAASPYSVELVA